MRIIDQPLPEVFLLDVPRSLDIRGSFTKLFHYENMISLGIDFAPVELFYTTSQANVLRGMHFQIGRAAHEKLVFCQRGKVLDVVVDVRPTSPNFNKPISVELSDDKSRALLIGKGYAHGFLSLTNDSWMIYATSTVHSPSLDKGVLWSSIDFEWPQKQPIISERDSCHPPISHLQ